MVKPSIVFFGSGPVAAASLAGILDSWEIELVITKARPAYHKTPAPVEELALQHDLPLKFANTKKEVDQVLTNTDIDSPVGLLVDFGVIVSPFAINRFEKGIINSHFSLLPRWRGADPITYCLLEGDDETGVSLMKIIAKLEEGPLIAQEKLPLPDKIDAGQLTELLVTLSNSMINKYLPLFLHNQLKTRPQLTSGVTYSHKIKKFDGIIDWAETADRIEREIRAYAIWPKSRTMLDGIDCIITEADVTKAVGTPGKYKVTGGSLLIFAKKDALSIKRLKPAGKKEMDIEAFLAGYKPRLKAN